MRKIVLIIFIFPALLVAQSPKYYFDKAANQYIDGDLPQAIETIDEAIRKFPNDPELQALKDRLLDEEEEQQNQENQSQGSQEENQEQENQEENEQQDPQDQQEGQEEEQEQEKSQEQMTKEKLEEMGISEEKALQLLEAMRQAEIKYLQHQRRKPTKRPPSGKPDW